MADFTLPWEQALTTYRFKYLALYHAIRSMIRDGSLPEGTRLPASRELAELYGLSRGSVAQAYDMLLAEGYVVARVGRGTFVAAGFAEARNKQKPAERGVAADEARRDIRDGAGHVSAGLTCPEADGGEEADGSKGGMKLNLSPWAARLLELHKQAEAEAGEEAAQAGRKGSSASSRVSFAGGGAKPPAEFPHAAWRSALAWASSAAYDGAADVFGDAGLRAAIAAHLRSSRGIAADPASICCFSGSMQAIALLSQLLLGEGARAVAEDPGYPGIRLAAAAAGAAVIPAEVDGRGIVPRDWDARVLFVTPGRQFPTGAVLAPERRRELLAWAVRRNAVIVEDDFDSEFRWAGQPMEPLMAQDRGERVVFVGTFTKTLFPALRIGYAVLPPPLVEPVRRAKALFEPASPALLEQRTLARFMARGDYDKHLRRMRRIYGARYEVFRREMQTRLGSLFAPLPLNSGLHVYARWRRSQEDYRLFSDACRREGILFRDVEVYWTGPHPPGACFFFAHLHPEEIAWGIGQMEEIGRKIWGDGISIV
ncbi:hypothetical protein AWM70_14160 [Paenibacillus yonginensis]|uniref:HTH gntR-type domain-containing protein n=1 Tax=Paenibacillus yonginensis TaxID=1462996 RepID=A0A1B1N2G1_9BACL|nr:PLP-dependent aminotransferase family protein [Paenibacillus yonginensis]ANS75596.1 hypothetical protein AWM70_14160 [Paenibacillus yonginensis]